MALIPHIAKHWREHTRLHIDALRKTSILDTIHTILTQRDIEDDHVILDAIQQAMHYHLPASGLKEIPDDHMVPWVDVVRGSFPRLLRNRKAYRRIKAYVVDTILGETDERTYMTTSKGGRSLAIPHSSVEDLLGTLSSG